MKTFFDITPVEQTGHNCKLAAIAMAEQYFSSQKSLQAIPLHKQKRDKMSIRQISKLVGSLQGELLEVNQLTKILSLMGYETELIDVSESITVFEKNVAKFISPDSLIISFFAVDKNTGFPTTNYDGYNEHAAVLHGYDSEFLDITHWSNHFKPTLYDFYQSSMQLPEQRLPEYYIDIKKTNQEKKYDLALQQSEDYFLKNLDKVRKSIIPEPNSGFRGKLVVVKKPLVEHLMQSRANLMSCLEFKLILKSLDDMNNKIQRLLATTDAAYELVRQTANLLNQNIQHAQSIYDTSRDLEIFKQLLKQALEQARHEFANHRGWYQIHIALRCFLGLLLGCTIIPILLFSICSQKGYLSIFFETPLTDSANKLEQLYLKVS